MKRYAAMLICLAALLSGCAAEQTDTRAEDLQRKYAAMDGYAATVELTTAERDESTRYRLDVKSEGGETRVTVLEPEAIAGVSATVAGDALSLAYDGMALDAGGAATELNAVNGTDVVLRAAAEGFITEHNHERYGDADALRLCLETEMNGETLYVAVWFDEQDAPLYAEIERDGWVMQYLEFTNFTFGGI
ncbi:MAG: hypothetical protein IJQ98_07915, partial [Oscillospiraceae bacterium]|nr:hypothetical protein [Oscillospiraceae bacterium]